jgi:polyphenol oxidase
VIVHEVELRSGVGAWFTGRDPDQPSASDGNLAHRRPHRPDQLARARAAVGSANGTSPTRWHLMHQVHGDEVGVVGAATPVGAELRGVDAIVTDQVERPLAVQVADCVPGLLAGTNTVGAVHAGRNGVLAGVVPAAVDRLTQLEVDDEQVHAVVGPAIGGCCYEVPAELQDEVTRRVPDATATTTWGTPALDLPRAVVGQLEAAGVQVVDRVGSCTRCDPQGRWFSHRADPASGRQIGLVVRREPAA